MKLKFYELFFSDNPIFYPYEKLFQIEKITLKTSSKINGNFLTLINSPDEDNIFDVNSDKIIIDKWLLFSLFLQKPNLYIENKKNLEDISFFKNLVLDNPIIYCKLPIVIIYNFEKIFEGIKIKKILNKLKIPSYLLDKENIDLLNNMSFPYILLALCDISTHTLSEDIISIYWGWENVKNEKFYKILLWQRTDKEPFLPWGIEKKLLNTNILKNISFQNKIIIWSNNFKEEKIQMEKLLNLHSSLFIGKNSHLYETFIETEYPHRHLILMSEKSYNIYIQSLPQKTGEMWSNYLTPFGWNILVNFPYIFFNTPEYFYKLFGESFKNYTFDNFSELKDKLSLQFNYSAIMRKKVREYFSLAHSLEIRILYILAKLAYVIKEKKIIQQNFKDVREIKDILNKIGNSKLNTDETILYYLYELTKEIRGIDVLK